MMGATAATQLQDQEKNRKVWAVERALDRARDWCERVTGALGIARTKKETLRILELEPEVTSARDALTLAAREYELACGVPAPLSTGPQLRPSTVAALRTTNDEFRQIDDEVSRCEREINRLRPQIVQLTKTLAAQGAFPAFSTSDSDPASEAVLDSIYPERRAIRANNVHGVQLAIQKSVQLQTEFAELIAQLDKVTGEWNVARVRRDAIFAEFQAQGAGDDLVASKTS